MSHGVSSLSHQSPVELAVQPNKDKGASVKVPEVCEMGVACYLPDAPQSEAAATLLAGGVHTH